MKYILKNLSLYVAVSFSTAAMAITPVDIELQLLIDISGSINTTEYDLQLQGYANAFESERVQNAIIQGEEGKIAIQLIMWSGRNQQKVMIDWSMIDSVTSAESLSDNIASLARPFSGWTAIGSAVNYAYPLFNNNGFNGKSKIMDISGDGTNNQGKDPKVTTQQAIENGVDTINGIVIGTDENVVIQYLDDVVAGESPFLLAPANFDAFQLAIENKIVAEIAGTMPKNAIEIPEPINTSIFTFAIIFMLLKKRHQTRIYKESL